MLELAEDLRTGRYRPHPPLKVPIAKADGGHREIAVYRLRDRVAQRAVLEVLQRRTDAAMSPGSFGYRPGRGVAAALACTRSWLDRGLAWVADTDVERCFDSIPRRRLLEEVGRRVNDPVAAEFVAQCMGWDEAALDAAGIPQGACLAPWLCNVYLWRLDERIGEACIPLVRYADDLVLLAATRPAAQRALALCEATLRALRLRLNPLKTRIFHAATPFRFLGEWLGVTPRLTWDLQPCRSVADNAACH